VLNSKLMEIEFIDLAEQVLQVRLRGGYGPLAFLLTCPCICVFENRVRHLKRSQGNTLRLLFEKTV
jgi:hypothetical protein